MAAVKIVLTYLVCAGHGRRLQSGVESAFHPTAAFQVTGAVPAQRFATDNSVGKRAQSPLAYGGGWSWNQEPAWKKDFKGTAAAASAATPTTAPATATIQDSVIAEESAVLAPAPEKKKKKNKPSPTGLFAPAVLATKRAMGDRELNKLRAEIIKKHTKVISGFVDTSESAFGQLVLKRMFEAADKDNSGALDREEVRDALYALGFTFVKDKELDKIMKKADVDNNEVIDFEEFVKETPKVLRMNLVQLAKANGHDLGFLA
mmetsp:Transcript_32981/g.54270  ORF Transcript_32981/g.54270 Transcript_32981/m.54270 type:complete len:261 (+) Transcript_32981:1-783(+)